MKNWQNCQIKKYSINQKNFFRFFSYRKFGLYAVIETPISCDNWGLNVHQVCFSMQCRYISILNIPSVMLIKHSPNINLINVAYASITSSTMRRLGWGWGKREHRAAPTLPTSLLQSLALGWVVDNQFSRSNWWSKVVWLLVTSLYLFCYFNFIFLFPVVWGPSPVAHYIPCRS